MLLWFVITPILIAVVIFLLPSEKASKITTIAVQAVFTGATVYLFFLCKAEPIIERLGNFESVMGIILRADTNACVFIMLTSLIFLLVALYSYYEVLDRIFWFLFFIWEGILIGIFLSGDFFNIFVLVEIATVVVSILIMLKRDKRSMHDGMIYLMVNTVSIQFYLLGVGYIYKITGVLDIDAAAEIIKGIDKSSLILPYALIITSVSLKCAVMPLFSWLPKAHGSPGAPSSVSAILSGLHIKSGIYLFIRFQSVFQEVAIPEFFLIAGIFTGIAGFIVALSQTDIKLILAYHTISQIGMIMIGLNVNDINSQTGAIYHIINHAFFKSTLFLCAGIIIQKYDTREIKNIRGVLKRIPLIGIAAIIAIFGITGAPFFNGSISKYFIMSGANPAVNIAIIFINLGTIISFVKFSTILFNPRRKTAAVQDGELSEIKENDTKISFLQQLPVLILSGLCLAGGILGEQFISFLFNINLSLDKTDNLLNIIIFLLSVIAGFLIYKYFVSTSIFFKRIKEIELGFRGACVCLGLFLSIIIIITKVLS